ncbi:MAG: hypothetical protein HS115_14260 [Spirochaetales bacterium]|nr:hypothetical protein [Spirochaetales bacterium]
MVGRSRILWVDGSAGLVAGIVLLAFHPFWAELTGLPRWLLVFQGCANFVYAAFAYFLAARRGQPRIGLFVLVGGNLAYALLAAVFLIVFFPVCTAWGVLLFTAEVLVVGGLGILEWYLLLRTIQIDIRLCSAGQPLRERGDR